MPIRKLIIHTCILGVMLPSSTLVHADTALWNGSYVAEGECFCTGTQGRKIDSRIVPTPIGGQSISQVCERVGKGPALQKVNGKFNFTVFSDAQCGNGPFAEAAVSATDNNQCLGNLGINGEDCSVAGPKWDLVSAYAKKSTDANNAETPLGISETPLVTGGSHYITPPVSQTVATQSSDTRESLDTIQGTPVAQNTPIAEIVDARSNSTKIAKATPGVAPKATLKVVPQTREQIRARQIEHLAAARKRAEMRDKITVSKMAASDKPSKLVKPADKLLPEPTIATVDTDKKTKATRESVETVAKASSTEATTTNATTSVSALKLPAILRTDSPDFDYFEGAPVSYDFGGAGMSVAVSKSSHDRMQYVLSAAAAESYQEAAIGVGIFITPTTAERMTIIASAGLEYGMFNFSRDAIDADFSDTGAFINFATRFAVTRKFALQAGIGYSSFFEGDTVGSGTAFYNLTRNFDITAKAEAGDNDLLGFGIRYHY